MFTSPLVYDVVLLHLPPVHLFADMSRSAAFMSPQKRSSTISARRSRSTSRFLGVMLLPGCNSLWRKRRPPPQYNRVLNFCDCFSRDRSIAVISRIISLEFHPLHVTFECSLSLVTSLRCPFCFSQILRHRRPRDQWRLAFHQRSAV